jgi:hypothetical protein
MLEHLDATASFSLPKYRAGVPVLSMRLTFIDRRVVNAVVNRIFLEFSIVYVDQLVIVRSTIVCHGLELDPAGWVQIFLVSQCVESSKRKVRVAQ